MKSSQHVSDSLTFSLLIGPHWEPSQAFSPLFCFTWPRISAASITALCPLELPLRIEQRLSFLKWLERIVSVVLWVKLISGVGHIFASSVGSIMQDRSLSRVFSHFSSYLRGVFNYLVTDWVSGIQWAALSRVFPPESRLTLILRLLRGKFSCN